MNNITFISAGAGSGKTYRLANELETLLSNGEARPLGVIGTTFTKMAAAELRERVRVRLHESGHTSIANQMGIALLGTVNGVCGQLLQRFAFEAGLSPKQKVIDENEAHHLFNQALEDVLTIDSVKSMNALAFRLGLESWRAEVKSVVQAARANNLSVKQVQLSAETSAASLLQFFRKPSGRDLYQELQVAIRHAIKEIEMGDDTTKGSKDYLRLLNDANRDLEQKRFTWAAWAKLSKAKPTKKSMACSDAVRLIAGDVECVKALHDDVEHFCQQVFYIGSQTIEAYQTLKQKRGLIDFIDQEQLLYNCLQDNVVKETLADELDLLMVDEFQDTSPIQLALFLRLAQLAKKVIWVGDIKQAIYGFRGSDPELMQAILKHIEQNEGSVDILDTSWRSRPELVEYVNAIFIPAFANTMSADRVHLKPQHAVASKAAAVAFWQLCGSNKKKRANDLAAGIRQLIDSEYPIVDKQTGQQRAICYADIAVLCRSNVNLDGVADALAAWTIPILRQQTGLLATPEAALVVAAIRYLVDPRDDLAVAEIIALCDGGGPEHCLASRFTFLAEASEQADQDEDHRKRWGEDHRVIQALAAQRHRLEYLTPSEIVELILQCTGLRRIVLQWNSNTQNSRQRLVNLQQFNRLATEYELWSQNESATATLTGFLLRLHQLSQDDLDHKPVDNQVNAVQLLTHHRAKGLEWPVVIAMDLDAKLRSRIWGVCVEQGDTPFDITQPLKHRTLRYWPWPFGQQKKDIAVLRNIEESAIGIVAHEQALEEDKRLLYVSFTRPSDLLVIPLKDRKGEWLDCLQSECLLPDGDVMELPGNGIKIPTVVEILEAAEPIENQENNHADLHWFERLEPSEEKLPASVIPSRLPADARFKVVETIELGERIAVKGNPDMAQVGEAIHALIATQIINKPCQPMTLSERVIDEYGLTETIDPVEVLRAAQQFIEFSHKKLDAKQILVEQPIEYRLPNGQVASGWIDALIETEEGFIIVDHKSSPKSRAIAGDEASKYTGQLSLYQQAVESASGKPVIGCWIHFAVMGLMVRLAMRR
ncbi:MAG: UvrD-helicase domain-containing protein [Thiohalomonadales bacterium]